jgi:hypothetical protein
VFILGIVVSVVVVVVVVAEEEVDTVSIPQGLVFESLHPSCKIQLNS